MPDLVDLPVDLLILLPQFLHNIEDFTNASSSCRTLRSVFPNTLPNTILQLAAASSRVFFRPNPYFLIAATARQISDWALLNRENAETLRRAFQSGMEALFDLCTSKAGLTLGDVCRLHASRFSLINPISDMIDRCAGAQWSLFQIIIYGELFYSSMRAALEPALALQRFDLDTRLDFIKYCIPDWACWLAYYGLEVRNIGPYVSGENDVIARLVPDQVGLNHILHCRTWREAWKKVRRKIGPDFNEQWRQQMWHSAVQVQGWDGLEMLRPGGVEKWRWRLEEIKGQITALDPASRPTVHTFGKRQNRASDSPYMADEVYVCMAGLWPE